MGGVRHVEAESFDQKFKKMQRLLITTPIFYVNGPPHLGHVYSCVVADAMTRFNRLKGNQVRLITGTDEVKDSSFFFFF